MSQELTHTDLLVLRRLCREHPDVRANAALLFAQICDAHELSQGCIKLNPCLASELNCSTRSIRAWLAELKEIGFVAESQRGGRRLLIPQVPDSRRREFSEAEYHFRKEASGSERSFRNGEDMGNDASGKPGTMLPAQRDIMPADAREGARAHVASTEKGPGHALVKETDPSPVAVFVEHVGRRPHGSELMEIPHVVGDTDQALRVFRKQCIKARRNVDDPGRVRWGYLAEDFERAMEQARASGDGMASAPPTLSDEPQRFGPPDEAYLLN